ncbi:cell surface glycoprotein 1-like [Entelurus aequoreus]|uniref:cell surface glycoprotein 1-like n=1 Tax=Entelurus aequoreus TaxID=161455 RepID=UPI002B1E72B9|nr:cell surface glycoprotein 1-like [Entelurus aequoreus]XP_061896614.1 cell surface glycoprotein 1-like [Entelurus aequoreus]
MGNKLIRKRESLVGSAASPEQKPTKDQTVAPDGTPAQKTVPAEKLDVVVGEEVAKVSCLPGEQCVSKLETAPEADPKPNPEACAVEPAPEPTPAVDGENDLSSMSSSPSVEMSTPDGTPQPYQTPTEVLLSEGAGDDAAAALESSSLDPETPEEEPEPAEKPAEVEAAGDTKQREESVKESLKELNLNAGTESDLLDDIPIDTCTDTAQVM